MKVDDKLHPAAGTLVLAGPRLRPMRSGRRLLGMTVLRLILITGAITIIFPFVWVLSTSLESLNDAITMPPQLVPSQFAWSNYTDIFQQVLFGRFFLNTVVMSVGRTMGQLITCSLAEYAFARSPACPCSYSTSRCRSSSCRVSP